MAIDAMNEETRIKLFAEIAWEMQHLPLSQAEVERDEDKILHGLLRPRCLSLTPWQVLTIRSVNFKMVSVKVSHTTGLGGMVRELTLGGVGLSRQAVAPYR